MELNDKLLEKMFKNAKGDQFFTEEMFFLKVASACKKLYNQNIYNNCLGHVQEVAEIMESPTYQSRMLEVGLNRSLRKWCKKKQYLKMQGKIIHSAGDKAFLHIQACGIAINRPYGLSTTIGPITNAELLVFLNNLPLKYCSRNAPETNCEPTYFYVQAKPLKFTGSYKHIANEYKQINIKKAKDLLKPYGFHPVDHIQFQIKGYNKKFNRDYGVSFLIGLATNLKLSFFLLRSIEAEKAALNVENYS